MARALKLAGSPLVGASLSPPEFYREARKRGRNDGRTLPVVHKALFWDAIALSLSRGANCLPTDPRRTT